MGIQIFTIDSDGDRREITDLYWFEEHGVHDFGGDSFYGGYTFEIYVDGVCVYPAVKLAKVCGESPP